MAELLDVLDAFSTPLKIAWVVWIAWGVGQLFWYRYERKPQVAASKPPASPVRKPFVSRPSTPDRVVTRLVTPEPMLTHQAEPVGGVADGPVGVADNAAGQLGELDRFVADFEMNTRQRRAQPHNGEPYDTHPGA